MRAGLLPGKKSDYEMDLKTKAVNFLYKRLTAVKFLYE